MNSSSMNIKVKWGKMTFSDVQLNLPPDIDIFQAQIFSLTGVPPERQKLLHKGSQIKDFNKLNLAEGMLIYLIGSGNLKSSIPVEIANVESNLNKKIFEPHHNSLPTILLNLGNTCYLNATVQFLRCISELREILKEYRESKIGTEDTYSIAYSLSGSLRDLFKDLDNAPYDGVVSPVNLLHILQLVAPNFCERDHNGSLMQQDANECLSLIIRMLQSELPPLKNLNNDKFSFIDQYLMGKFEILTKCIENEDNSLITDEFLQLTCFISQEVKLMSTGIQMSLNEEINKYSTILNRNSTYKRKYSISRLPSYLIVNFLRFYYKEKVKTNAKILREVKFPFIFDAYDFCTDELKRELEPMREIFKKEEKYLSQRNNFESKEENKNHNFYPFSFANDIGSNNSGYYNLKAVITHKGRTSNAGHYIAWVKIQDSEKNLWAKVDDDIRYSDVTEEEIKKLAGGSDNHTAYLLLYGPHILEKNKP